MIEIMRLGTNYKQPKKKSTNTQKINGIKKTR